VIEVRVLDDVDVDERRVHQLLQLRLAIDISLVGLAEQQGFAEVPLQLFETMTTIDQHVPFDRFVLMFGGGFSGFA
jgi:hypothetical protein